MTLAGSCEVQVKSRFGVALDGAPTLPATNVRFGVGLGGEGFLSCDVDARAEPIASDDDLIDDCVLTVGVPLAEGAKPTEILAFANRSRSGDVWDGSGRKTRRVLSAPTLWTAWSQDAILHPEGNVMVRLTSEERYFGWMSTIYDQDNDPDYSWSSPVGNIGAQDSTTGNRSGEPTGWPSELSDAVWLNGAKTGQAEARVLYVADLTLTRATAIEIYFSSDESSMVFFGGELVIQTATTETGFTEISTWKGFMPAGTYRVAIDNEHVFTRPGGNGRDCVLLGVVELDESDNIDSVLLETTAAGWDYYVVYGSDPVPSLTPGEIALELHSQADDRGVDTWAAITPTFSATTDSDGTAWPDREERAWRLGYDTHLDMCEGLGDLGFDPEITPDLDWNVYADRGSDLSASVVVEAIVNSSMIVEEGDAVSANYMPVETQAGWTVVQSSSSQSTYGRREAGLSMGNAPSITQGNNVGAKVMAERLAVPTSQWSVDFYASAGCVPFADFNLGDTITVKVGGVSYSRVVLEIGGQADSVNSIVKWTLTTGNVLS